MKKMEEKVDYSAQNFEIDDSPIEVVPVKASPKAAKRDVEEMVEDTGENPIRRHFDKFKK